MFIALINFSVVFWRAVVLGSFGQHNKNWNGSCLGGRKFGTLRNCIKVSRALILCNTTSIQAVSFTSSDCLDGLNENSEQAKYNLCLLYGLLSAIYATAGDIRRSQPIHGQYKERYMCGIITVNKDIINAKLLCMAYVYNI